MSSSGNTNSENSNTNQSALTMTMDNGGNEDLEDGEESSSASALSYTVDYSHDVSKSQTCTPGMGEKPTSDLDPQSEMNSCSNQDGQSCS